MLYIYVVSTPLPFVLFLNQLEPNLYQYHSTKIALTVVKKQFHAAKSSGQLSVLLLYLSKRFGTVGWSLS